MYREYGVAMTTLARSLLRDPEEAADVVEDALIRIRGAAPGFRGERGLKTWVLRIVTNRCRDLLRRRRFVAGTPDDHDPLSESGLRVDPVEGWAEINGGEARSPHIQVRNRSNQTVKYVELAWLVSDPKGQQYVAASLPASDPELFLPPGKTAEVLQDTELRVSRRGEPVNIQKMMGFISQVQFADGKVWVPNRQNLENAALLKVLAPSAEEQRLTDLYRKKGLAALVEELKKF